MGMSWRDSEEQLPYLGFGKELPNGARVVNEMAVGEMMFVLAVHPDTDHDEEEWIVWSSRIDAYPRGTFQGGYFRPSSYREDERSAMAQAVDEWERRVDKEICRSAEQEIGRRMDEIAERDAAQREVDQLSGQLAENHDRLAAIDVDDPEWADRNEQR